MLELKPLTLGLLGCMRAQSSPRLVRRLPSTFGRMPSLGSYSLNESNKVLAIIPAHNEEDNIGEVVDEIRSADPRIDILAVNDASTDGTSNAARKLGVRVADLPINLGIGGAVQTGFKIAKELEYEIVVQIDADGQHDPVGIKDVMEPLLAGEADLSIG